jgi:hypothetical protein
MDIETMQTTDSIQDQQRETTNQREEGNTPTVGDTRMPDHIEAQASDNTKEEGKRRAHSNTRTHLNTGGMEVCTDTQEEPQQERRRFGGDERRWGSEEIVDVDDDLGWNKSGNAEGHPEGGGNMKTEANITSPKNQKNQKQKEKRTRHRGVGGVDQGPGELATIECTYPPLVAL